MKQALLLVVGFVLLAATALAQDSNPDGVVGKPVFEISGGLRTGSGETSTGQGVYLIKRDADFSGSGLGGAITYPASRNISLVFRVSGDWQTTKYPETADFFKQESKFGTYAFIFGIRIFTQ